jgi:hypothetical protein
MIPSLWIFAGQTGPTLWKVGGLVKALAFNGSSPARRTIAMARIGADTVKSSDRCYGQFMEIKFLRIVREAPLSYLSILSKDCPKRLSASLAARRLRTKVGGKTARIMELDRRQK